MFRFSANNKYIILIGLLLYIPTLNGIQPFLGAPAYHIPQGKGAYQFRTVFFDFENGNDTVITHSFAYGLLERLNIDLVLPYFVKRKQDCQESSGFGDLYVRANYDLYTHVRPETDTFYLFLFEAIRFPTASTKTTPILSRGTYDFRIGAALHYNAPHFSLFTSVSGETSTTFKGIKPGNAFETTLVTALRLNKNTVFQLETNFLWIGQRKIRGIKDPLSDGSVIYMGPEFSYETQLGKIMLAISWPIMKHKINPGLRGGFYINIYF